MAWGKSGTGAVKTRDRRQFDLRIDTAWGGLLDRLQAYARLPADKYPAAARAQELVDTLSPDGREWLTIVYEAEWAESNKRLDLSPPGSEGPTISGIAGDQGPTRWRGDGSSRFPSAG